ncbi:periplasmic heavy metal sensor [Alphaproteobacteria bacterium GH1-50]|uniref:Periplasmic heavy metal sensor n=1 Tax=Kangsaoukella pontilimi TaxID=2691042 RepID=A0A7C9MHQ5_9RHOB|nr:periplasmic heavy metal sensor [Kangsaoukella pontilimi]MXQ06315.1 periplasmic heavy metal sensor [Kangsaoukella pontilimi]
MSAPGMPEKPHRRWMWPLLVVSLALNLLVAGVIIGALMRGDGERPPGAARSLIGEPFVRALDEDDRRAFLREMVGNRDRLRANRADLRARLEALLSAIAAEDFDRARVAAILAEQRQLAVRRQDIGETLLLDRLEGMSVEERRGYAERLERAFRRRPRD